MNYLEAKEKRAIQRAIKNNGFVRLESLNDGNCFFYSLETYYYLNDIEDRADFNVLRKLVVDEIMSNPANYVHFIPEIPLNNAGGNEVKPMTDDERLVYLLQEAEKLGEQGAWNSQLGDFVPELAALILHINIDIYEPDGDDLRVTPVHIDDADAPLITLLRINRNHYDLLIPEVKYTKVIAKKWLALKKFRNEGEAAALKIAIQKMNAEEAAAAGAGNVKPKKIIRRSATKKAPKSPSKSPNRSNTRKAIEAPRRSARLTAAENSATPKKAPTPPSKRITRRRTKEKKSNIDPDVLASLLNQGLSLEEIEAMQGAN